MSVVMEEEIKRWTVRRKSALVLDIIQGKTTVAEACRQFDIPPSEIESWVDDGKRGLENALRAKPEDVREQYERQLKDLQEAYGGKRAVTSPVQRSRVVLFSRLCYGLRDCDGDEARDLGRTHRGVAAKWTNPGGVLSGARLECEYVSVLAACIEAPCERIGRDGAGRARRVYADNLESY